MQKVLVAMFGEYRRAEAAVRDLEIAGIVGEQVEVISNVDQDERAQALGMKPREGVSERIARIFRGLRHSGATEVLDDPGEMPSYIGEQEFYATHVRNEGALMIVRVPNDKLAGVAQAILKQHGSKQRDGAAGVTIRETDERPGIATANA